MAYGRRRTSYARPARSRRSTYRAPARRTTRRRSSSRRSAAPRSIRIEVVAANPNPVARPAFVGGQLSAESAAPRKAKY